MRIPSRTFRLDNSMLNKKSIPKFELKSYLELVLPLQLQASQKIYETLFEIYVRGGRYVKEIITTCVMVLFFVVV